MQSSTYRHVSDGYAVVAELCGDWVRVFEMDCYRARSGKTQEGKQRTDAGHYIERVEDRAGASGVICV